eukprot:357682-Chlamydomonas_euryale.AAC.1
MRLLVELAAGHALSAAAAAAAAAASAEARGGSDAAAMSHVALDPLVRLIRCGGGVWRGWDEGC